MVRCVRCGTPTIWVRIPVVNCTQCGYYIVMPALPPSLDEPPPYHWFIDQSEGVLILDALESMMDTFQRGLAVSNLDEETRNGITGSFLFARMTRQRLRKLMPDLVLPEEVDAETT